MKLFRKIIISIFILSSIILIWDVWAYYSALNSTNKPQYTNIKIPVEFIAGKKYSKEFYIEEEEKYEISIRFHRLISPLVLDSLIGKPGIISNENREVCLPVKFSLWKKDSLIIKIDSLTTSSFSYTADYIKRYLGIFQGEKIPAYRLEFETYKTLTELNKTHPVLVISVLPVFYKNHHVKNLVVENIAEKVLIYAIIIFVLISSIFFLEKVYKRESNR